MKRALAVALLVPLATLRAHSQGDGRDARQPADEVLRRDPRALPRAAEGRWSAWAAVQKPPEELAGELREGTRAYLAADYGAAASSFFALLEREPDFPPALYQLGVTYFRLRRYGDCARVFERFLAVAPQEVGATQALAHSYYSLGEYERALEHYTQVLAANPSSVEALRGFALSQMRLGRLEESLASLERCLELRPKHAEALYWKAKVLFDLSRSQEARTAAEAARELDPFDPRPHFLLSQVLYELGDDEGAAAAERRFLELNLLAQKVRTLEGFLLAEPRRVDVYARLVDVHRTAGNSAAVQETVQRLLRAVPADLGARVLALTTLRELGATDAAQEVAGGIERDFAEVVEAWRALRDHYGAVGDRVREIRAGERYLRLGGDPGR